MYSKVLNKRIHVWYQDHISYHNNIVTTNIHANSTMKSFHAVSVSVKITLYGLQCCFDNNCQCHFYIISDYCHAYAHTLILFTASI